MRTASSGEGAMIRLRTRIVLKDSGLSAGWARMYRHPSRTSPILSRRDTAVGPACSTRIALRGKASNTIRVPNVLTVYAEAARSTPSRGP